MPLDAIRGGLVILMAIYHAAYTAVITGLASLELYEGFWWLFPRTIAAGFIVISGWSLAGKKARGSTFRTFLVRAGRLAVPALAITAISAFMFGKGFVFFGILHLLAASSILAWPLLGRPGPAVASACLVLGGGLLLGSQRYDWPYLAWLGFRPSGLYPVDYLPLLPWFAWCLFGAAARDLMHKRRNGRSPTLHPVPSTASRTVTATCPDTVTGVASPLVAVLDPLAWAGRHSLEIYLVHLPVLYGLASLIARLTRS
jgi:uncharacterized membrane protein